MVKNLKGELVISLDTEIAWGWISFLKKRTAFYPLFDNAKEVIERLMAVFDQYETPVTWAVVGRLMEENKDRHTYFQRDINTVFSTLNSNLDIDQIPQEYISFYGLIEKIKKCKVSHDIGTHTYNHLYTKDLNDSTAHIMEEDFTAMKRKFAEYDLEMTSMIFPKNQIGFLSYLPQYNVKIYRSPDLYWYSGYSGFLRKILSQIDSMLPITPCVSKVKEDKYGTKYTSGSLLFRQPHQGFKKIIPMSVIKHKALKGIKRAIKEKKVFHLWFHPFNFGHRTEEHFQMLSEVLQFAKTMEQSGKLRISTMRDLI